MSLASRSANPAGHASRHRASTTTRACTAGDRPTHSLRPSSTPTMATITSRLGRRGTRLRSNRTYSTLTFTKYRRDEARRQQDILPDPACRWPIPRVRATPTARSSSTSTRKIRERCASLVSRVAGLVVPVLEEHVVAEVAEVEQRVRSRDGERSRGPPRRRASCDDRAGSRARAVRRSARARAAPGRARRCTSRTPRCPRPPMPAPSPACARCAAPAPTTRSRS